LKHPGGVASGIEERAAGRDVLLSENLEPISIPFRESWFADSPRIRSSYGPACSYGVSTDSFLIRNPTAYGPEPFVTSKKLLGMMWAFTISTSSVIQKRHFPIIVIFYPRRVIFDSKKLH
jgi:hypothetical protein